MFLNENDVDSQFGKRPLHRHCAGPVKRCVNGPQVITFFFNKAGTKRQAFDHVDKRRIDLFVNHLEEAGRKRLVFRQRKDGRALDFAYFGYDFLVVRGDDLAAVGPIDLVAVVFSRIVRGRYHDARGGAQEAHGKGKLGRGSKRGKQIRGNIVSAQHARGLLGKLIGKSS